MKKQINEELSWIENAIEAFAETAEKDGEYWRATYTKEDQKGVMLLEKWLKDKGFQTRFDEVGNLYGRIEGKEKSVILTGSHRDTVKNGGKFDGALGILTAIQAASSLKKEYGQPQKSIEVVAMCEEESSRFLTGYIGSRAIIGALSEQNLWECDDQGISAGEAMAKCGYYKGALPTPRKDIERFVELHIEQGGNLESEGISVGIVEAIVGLYIGTVIFTGNQNHAGTTSMRLRRDPMPAAAALILTMTNWASEKNEQAVCTFGNMVVEPGKSNVIPEKVTVTFDIRSGKKEILQEADQLMRTTLEKNGKEIGITLNYACQDPPAQMCQYGIEALKTLAKEKGIKILEMNSGAGHDSQIISEAIPTNMIFVPSKDGISHSPLEFTSTHDMSNGYELLKEYLKSIAWKEERKK